STTTCRALGLVRAVGGYLAVLRQLSGIIESREVRECPGCRPVERRSEVSPVQGSGPGAGVAAVGESDWPLTQHRQNPSVPPCTSGNSLLARSSRSELIEAMLAFTQPTVNRFQAEGRCLIGR